ncbi:dynein axonemal heavy chain 6-like isoform X1 [Montipora foliosa]|uniref:dynein axonemal heavy chain 6-like isoform X1 n=1 Tax=Montipora foliosa TaxID=591990 RepID=UPI0035F177BD
MLLGQGHWPVAEKMITNATKTGDRIFLQEVQEDFALFLNCMLTKTFPVTVLQNSVKVANKPSKGSKQILKELLVNSVLIHLRVIERKKFGQLDWNVRVSSKRIREQVYSRGFCAYFKARNFLYVQVQRLGSRERSGQFKDVLYRRQIPWDALTYITGQITCG